MSDNKRYFIEGRHDESDCEWLECESDDLEEIKKHYLEQINIPIHDEIMLLVHKDEMFVIKEVKRIMEDVTDVIKNIPMIIRRYGINNNRTKA